MSGKIQISISGNGAAFGNVVQGNGNHVSSVQRVAAGFDGFDGEIEGLGNKAGVDSAEVASLRREMDALKERIHAGDEESSLSDRIRAIAARFSWAIPALKALAVHVLPKIAAAVFG